MGPYTAARLVRLAMLLALGLLAIAVEAAPLGHTAAVLPSPDLLFLLVVHFSIRRPGSTPMLAVFALGLLRDLLTDVPVGIGALALVAASEIAKSLHPNLRRASFASELMVVALGFAAVLLVQFLAVALTFLQPPAIVMLLQQWALTVAIYPILALVLRWMFRIGWREAERA